MQIIYMEITPVFFGDCLLLQVVVLVDTANLWSYEDTSCAESPKENLGCKVQYRRGPQSEPLC